MTSSAGVSIARDDARGRHELLAEMKRLSGLVRGQRNVYFDSQSWAGHQRLQSSCHELLLHHLDFALDHRVENELWTVCYKEHIAQLQACIRDRSPLNKSKATEAQVVLNLLLETAKGFYILILQQGWSLWGFESPVLPTAQCLVDDCQAAAAASTVKEKNVIYFVQHCLVHLGDLARYKSQMDQAETYYRQAMKIAPGSGQSYNQIALLEANRGNKLSATFFYVRAMALQYPFPAAAANLSSVLQKLEKDYSSLPVTATSSSMNAQTFVPYMLRFFGLLHHARQLRVAKTISVMVSNSLNALMATESNALGTVQLLQIVCINLFFLNNAFHEDMSNGDYEQLADDEKSIVHLLEECLATLLNAFLLPVYTLKQGSLLLNYYALPATKLALDWILLNPNVLQRLAFYKRLQIWPSLCRMLNELSRIIASGSAEMSHVPGEFPLPEEYDLQAFMPLWPRLSARNFRAVSEHVVSEKDVCVVRAKRLLEIGHSLCALEVAGQQLIACHTGEHGEQTFEPIEQQIPRVIADQLKAESEESLEKGAVTDASPASECASTTEIKSILKQTAPAALEDGAKKRSRNVALSTILKQTRGFDEDEQSKSTANEPHPFHPVTARNEESSKQVSFKPATVETLYSARPERAPLRPLPLMDIPVALPAERGPPVLHESRTPFSEESSQHSHQHHLFQTGPPGSIWQPVHSHYGPVHPARLRSEAVARGDPFTVPPPPIRPVRFPSTGIRNQMHPYGSEQQQNPLRGEMPGQYADYQHGEQSSTYSLGTGPNAHSMLLASLASNQRPHHNVIFEQKASPLEALLRQQKHN